MWVLDPCECVCVCECVCAGGSLYWNADVATNVAFFEEMAQTINALGEHTQISALHAYKRAHVFVWGAVSPAQ